METAAVIEPTSPSRSGSPFRATIDTCGTRVVFLRDGRPILELVHVGEGEFRLAGWTDERILPRARAVVEGWMSPRARDNCVPRSRSIQ